MTTELMMLKREPSEKERLLGMFARDYSPLVAIGQRLGAAALDVVLEEMGGQKPHVPRAANFWGQLERRVRDEQIRAAFHGNNYRELAIQFGLEERQIRHIVDGRRRHPESTKAIHVADTVCSDYETLAKERGAESVRALVSATLEAALASPEVMAEVDRRLGLERVKRAA